MRELTKFIQFLSGYANHSSNLIMWKRFLELMGIEYSERQDIHTVFSDDYTDHEVIKSIDIIIDRKHFGDVTDPNVVVVFERDTEKFRFILPYGES